MSTLHEARFTHDARVSVAEGNETTRKDQLTHRRWDAKDSTASGLMPKEIPGVPRIHESL